MSPPLNWHVDSRDGLALVTVTGICDATSAAGLHRVVVQCLHREPVAVLLDLSRMTIADVEAAKTFADMVYQADSWPGTPLLLCTADAVTTDVITRAAGDSLPVFGTAAEALSTLTDYGPPVNELILPVQGAARHARNSVTEACLRWDLPHLIAPVTLAASELITNAVVHARTVMTLQVRLRPRYLYLAVFDDDHAEPVPRTVDNVGIPGGRGLHIVEHVAIRWGYRRFHAGKVVWAAFAVSVLS